MLSLRARLTNVFLRLTAKRMWRPDLDIHEIRRLTAKMDQRIARAPLPVATEEAAIDGVRATWVGDASHAAKGVLLYLHGGAWCVHLPATYRRFAAALAVATGLRVLLVDYRLAPEHPFPAAIDDCLVVYRWLVDNGYVRRPLAVAGDSAGGNLTLVTLMRARDAGLPLPNCAALISPATDLTLSGPSIRYNADADAMFSSTAGDILPGLYCPGELHTNPLISPLFGNWNGLPPLLFHAGSTEMLLDDSVRAHDRACQAGTVSAIEVWLDLPHVFHVISWLPEARRGIDAVAQFILGHLATPHSPELTRAAPAVTLDSVAAGTIAAL